MRVLVFGASITQGFWDSEGGWVNRIRKHYDSIYISGVIDDAHYIFNLGISGDSSNELALRIEDEIEARNRPGELAIVISIGINDARTKAGKNFSDTDLYLSNLTKITRVAKNYTDKILFVGLTPCDEARTNPVAWGDTGYTKNRIWEFETTLRKFCEQNEFPLARLFEKLEKAQSQRNILFDGLHPNDDGHKLITSVVLKELDSLIDSN